MKYRRLGRTGLEISEIVFGAGFVGGVLIHQGEAMGREALERARALGINWIDTAPSYGDGKSESALGKLLPAIGWQPRLSTKFRVDPAAPAPIATQIGPPRHGAEGTTCWERCPSRRTPLLLQSLFPAVWSC